MEAYSSSYSSSKTSYLSQNTDEEAKAKGLKHVYPFKSHYSLLHSVRKSPAKPWKKAPIAPMPPTPVKEYKVDAINFKDIVQQLTSEPEFKPSQPRHKLLQSTEPSERASSVTSVHVPWPPMKNVSTRDTSAAASPTTASVC